MRAFIVVGLRNPEPKRINDRHNVGSRVLLSLVKEATLNEKSPEKISWKLRDDSLSLELDLNRRVKIVLVLANVSMNETGLPVKKVMQRYQAELGDLIVIQDDLDLPFGKIRIKKGSRDGGHRGIRSIIEEVGSEDFIRLKIGVGRPPDGVDVLTFVLSSFTEEEKEALILVCKEAGDALRAICLDGLEAAQNKINSE